MKNDICGGRFEDSRTAAINRSAICTNQNYIPWGTIYCTNTPFHSKGFRGDIEKTCDKFLKQCCRLYNNLGFRK